MDLIVLIGIFTGLTAFLVIYGIWAPVRATATTNTLETPHDRIMVDDGWHSTQNPVNKPDGPLQRVILPFVRNFVPQTPMAAQLKASQRHSLNELLVRSGNPWNVTPEELQGLRLVSLGIFALIAAALAMSGLLPFPPIAAAAVGALLGFLIPKNALVRAKKKRAREAAQGLPEALDLLRITMNAGKNFTPALQVTVAKIPAGFIQDELRRMYTDLQSGRTLTGALADFVRRVPTPEVESFVRSVLQSERLGADLTATLKNQALAARAASEAALDRRVASLSSVMLIVIMLLGLPSLLLVILSPALSSIMTSFG